MITARINNEIQHYGCSLFVGVDPDRPWSVIFIARLSRRLGAEIVGRGDSPTAAMDDLDTQLACQEL